MAHNTSVSLGDYFEDFVDHKISEGSGIVTDFNSEKQLELLKSKMKMDLKNRIYE